MTKRGGTMWYSLLLLPFLGFFLFASPVHTQTTPRCCVPEAKATGATSVPVNTCRLVEPTRPCETTYTSKTVCRNDRTNQVLIQSSCPSDDWVRSDLDVRETEVDCVAEPRCRNSSVISQQIVDCKQFRSGAACPTGACFWYEGDCYNRQDNRICHKLRRKDVCDGGAGSKKCVWKQETGKCISPLQAQATANIDYSQPGAFPNCGHDGTCDSVNDVLAQQLGYANWAFGFVGVVAFVGFVAGGIGMIVSFGNPERFKKGQQMLVASIIGLVISLSAFILVEFILDTLGVATEFRGI